VALGHVSLRVLQFSSVSIIPPVLRVHLHLHVILTRRTNGKAGGLSKNKSCFGNRGALNVRVF